MEGALYRLGARPVVSPVRPVMRPAPLPPRQRSDPPRHIERRLDLHIAIQRYLTDEERDKLTQFYGIGERPAAIIGMRRGEVRPIVRKLRDLLAEE